MNTQNAEGKVILVTGGTSGVGQAAARGLAERGATVVLLVRNAERGQGVLDDIAKTTGNPRGQLVVGDFENMASLRRAGAEVGARYPRLDGLLHSAAALQFQQRRTPEGLDAMFAINYFGAFVLTNAVLGALQHGGPARIAFVAARPSFLRNPRVNFDDLQLEHSFSGMRALGQTLYARVALSYELARRLSGSNVTSVAFHPGAVGGSQLAKDAPWWARALGTLFAPMMGSECRIAVDLLTSPDFAGKTGVFYDDKRRECAVPDDPVQGARLWAVSEALAAQIL